MNREKGMSSLSLVLLLLVLGSMMLTGLNQQLDSFTRIINSESQIIQQQVAVQSALEWGRKQSWQLQPEVQCQPFQSLRVCLRVLANNRVLLIAGSRDVLLWRSGIITGGSISFSPHGWSDFCPLKEGALCQLP